MKADVARARNLGWVIGVCVLIALLEGYDVQAFGVAAPRLAPELGLNPGQIGWAGSAANIGLLMGALLGGWAADRWGRKPVLLASVLASAPSPWPPPRRIASTCSWLRGS